MTIIKYTRLRSFLTSLNYTSPTVCSLTVYAPADNVHIDIDSFKQLIDKYIMNEQACSHCKMLVLLNIFSLMSHPNIEHFIVKHKLISVDAATKMLHICSFRVDVNPTEEFVRSTKVNLFDAKSKYGIVEAFVIIFARNINVKMFGDFVVNSTPDHQRYFNFLIEYFKSSFYFADNFILQYEMLYPYYINICHIMPDSEFTAQVGDYCLSLIPKMDKFNK